MQGPQQPPGQPHGGQPPRGQQPGYPTSPPSGYPPQQGPPQQSAGWGSAQPPYAASNAPKKPSPLPLIATIASLIGALVALVYGGYAITARRGVFADLADDAGSVSSDAASGSDTTNGILMAVALVVVLVAIGLWVAVVVIAKRGRNPIGFGGFGAVGVGAIAALIGALITSGVDDVDEAGGAATGYILVGIGFVLIAIGLLLGAVALRQEPDSGSNSNMYGPQSYGGPSYGSPPYGGSQAPQYPQGPPQQDNPYGNPPGPPQAPQAPQYPQGPPQQDNPHGNPPGQNPQGPNPYGPPGR